MEVLIFNFIIVVNNIQFVRVFNIQIFFMNLE